MTSSETRKTWGTGAGIVYNQSQTLHGTAIYADQLGRCGGLAAGAAVLAVRAPRWCLGVLLQPLAAVDDPNPEQPAVEES